MELREVELSQINLPLLLAFSKAEEVTEIEDDLSSIIYDYKNQKTIFHECLKRVGTKSLGQAKTTKKGQTDYKSANIIDDSKTV